MPASEHINCKRENASRRLPGKIYQTNGSDKNAKLRSRIPLDKSIIEITAVWANSHSIVFFIFGSVAGL